MEHERVMDAEFVPIRQMMESRYANNGGKNPCVSLTFIPSDRAARITALDARVEQMKKASPFISKGTGAMFCVYAAAMGWMKPGLAALIVAALMIWAMVNYKRGDACA